jgi:hypothetical protein
MLLSQQQGWHLLLAVAAPPQHALIVLQVAGL